VKPASIDANLARISLTEVSIAEASVSPFIRAENSSEIILKQCLGIRKLAGTLVSADSSSTTSLQGYINIVGTIQNVISYPSVLRTSGYVRMSGSPFSPPIQISPTALSEIQMLRQSPILRGRCPLRSQNDQQMGPVTTVKHSATVGTQENNRVNFGNIVSRAAAFSGDILVSVLVESISRLRLCFGRICRRLFGNNCPFGGGEMGPNRHLKSQG